MSSGGTYRVEGIKELRRALKGADMSLQNFKDVNSKVSSYVGATAAQLAPRRSGMLAASWRPAKSTTQAAVRFGGARAPYANAVHWGTGPRVGRRGPHNIKPDKFAVRAVHATESVWGPWYMEHIDDALEKWDLE